MSNHQFALSTIFQQAVQKNILDYDQLPSYDLFLSQVVDFLNAHFPDAAYTPNIIQNYIKLEVISAPVKGKKRGYTKEHIIQLALVTHMRPLLTAEEIKKVFSLAFNEINNLEDDIITWDVTYQYFSEIQRDLLTNSFTLKGIDEKKFAKIVEDVDLSNESIRRIHLFLTVLTFIAQATITKKLVQKIVNENLNA